MSEELEYFDNTPPPGSEMTMFETWIAAISKPNENTFREIANQSGASTGKAFMWVALGALMTSFSTLLAQMFSFGNQMGGFRDILPPELARELPMDIGSAGIGAGLGSLFCGTPMLIIMTLIGFAINVGLVQWVAKMFGGTGDYEKLAYTFSSIIVPYSAVSAVLSLLGIIPFVGILTGLISLGLGIYVIVLNVLAVKAVNNLDTGKAVGSVLLPGLVIFVFICCCFVIVGALLGPAIGEVFNEISNSLY